MKNSTKPGRLEYLYKRPLAATRSGPLFHAHSYPTKISPESIALMIACHTKPGDLVFDGFGGSCTTALAALLCSSPSDELSTIAQMRGLKPLWGPRRAVVYELTGLGSFIGETLCSQPDPARFAAAATRVLDEAERRYGWMYRTADERGAGAVARYFIWSELLECPHCSASVPFWNACVRLNPARISDRWKCRVCGKTANLNSTSRISERTIDSLLQTDIARKARRLSRVDGITGRRHWSRRPNDSDMEVLMRIQGEVIPRTVPMAPMMGKGGAGWGDLWRSGYHEGITHVHQFYTRRNLIALGALFEIAENEPKGIRDALRFWISSYNSSHSTLMTRVVAKQGQADVVLTSAQSGVLYVSGLPVEKNVFLGLRRKLKTVHGAFATLQGLKGLVKVRQGSCTRTTLADASVDYIFTDPPFGGNIPYSEVNFINEAWLGRSTCATDEVVVSPAQAKDIGIYETLLMLAFQEMRRVLKPKGKLTVVFHSTQAEVWRALSRAYSAAGFSVELSNILDKEQGSFKQVTTVNSVRGDSILLLTPQARESATAQTSPEKIIECLVSRAEALADPQERLPKRIYSRFVAHYLSRDGSPPIDAAEFYQKLSLMGVAK
jgi:transposase-like protein